MNAYILSLIGLPQYKIGTREPYSSRRDKCH